jgi:hypothetical protein
MNWQPPSKVACKSVAARRQESNLSETEIFDGTLRLVQLQSLVAVASTSPQAVHALDNSEMNKVSA